MLEWSTIKQIEGDGFEVTRRVEMLLSSDSAVGVTKSTGLGMIGFADALGDFIVSLYSLSLSILIVSSAVLPLGFTHLYIKPDSTTNRSAKSFLLP